MLVLIELRNGLAQVVEGTKFARAGHRHGGGVGRRQGARGSLNAMLESRIVDVRDDEEDRIEREQKRQRAVKNAAKEPGRRALFSRCKGAPVPQDYLGQQAGQECPLRNARLGHHRRRSSGTGR